MYFPWVSFLEATDVPNSSYVWKSLIAAKPILKRGCCWRVGDGANIWAFHDKWMPNYPTNKALYPPLDGDWDCRVSDFIDWNSHDWNRSIIAAKFHPKDMEAMVQIPLSRRHVLDVLMWLHNKKGLF